MKEKCKNHPDKKALSLCHSCGSYFCSDCLVEGSEYYYCKSSDCAQVYEQNEIVDSFIEEHKQRNKLLYDLKKSPVPFISISFFTALIIGAKLGYFKEDIIGGILISVGLCVVLWGVPFILAILMGFIITNRAYRSKIFYIFYAVSWIAVVILYLLGSEIF